MTNTTHLAGELYNTIIKGYPEIALRHRDKVSARSPLAKKAIKAARDAGARVVESIAHEPGESALARRQLHAVMQFEDGSLAAIYDTTVIPAASRHDVIWLKTRSGDLRFVGSWDGSNIEQLRDELMRAAEVLGAKSPEDMDILLKHLEIPNGFTSTLKKDHLLSGVGDVIAQDAKGETLLRRAGVFYCLADTVQGLRRSAHEAQTAIQALVDLMPDASSQLPQSFIERTQTYQMSEKAYRAYGQQKAVETAALSM